MRSFSRLGAVAALGLLFAHDGFAAPSAANQALVPRPHIAANQALTPPSGIATGAHQSLSADPEACKTLTAEQLLYDLRDVANYVLAACVIRHAQDFGAIVLRPAIAIASNSGDASSLVHLGKILDNRSPGGPYDAVTRSYAAAALGRINAAAAAADRTFAPPGVVLQELSACISNPLPRTVRHACMNAAGDGNITTLVPDLRGVLSGPAPPLDQFVAARALTRLLGSPQVSDAVAAAAKSELKTFIAP